MTCCGQHDASGRDVPAERALKVHVGQRSLVLDRFLVPEPTLQDDEGCSAEGEITVIGGGEGKGEPPSIMLGESGPHAVFWIVPPPQSQIQGHGSSLRVRYRLASSSTVELILPHGCSSENTPTRIKPFQPPPQQPQQPQQPHQPPQDLECDGGADSLVAAELEEMDAVDNEIRAGTALGKEIEQALEAGMIITSAQKQDALAAFRAGRVARPGAFLPPPLPPPPLLEEGEESLAGAQPGEDSALHGTAQPHDSALPRMVFASFRNTLTVATLRKLIEAGTDRGDGKGGVRPQDQRLVSIAESLPLHDTSLLPVAYSRVQSFYGWDPAPDCAHAAPAKFLSSADVGADFEGAPGGDHLRRLQGQQRGAGGGGGGGVEGEAASTVTTTTTSTALTGVHVLAADNGGGGSGLNIIEGVVYTLTDFKKGVGRLKLKNGSVCLVVRNDVEAMRHLPVPNELATYGLDHRSSSSSSSSSDQHGLQQHYCDIRCSVRNEDAYENQLSHVESVPWVCLLSVLLLLAAVVPAFVFVKTLVQAAVRSYLDAQSFPEGTNSTLYRLADEVVFCALTRSSPHSSSSGASLGAGASSSCPLDFLLMGVIATVILIVLLTYSLLRCLLRAPISFCCGSCCRSCKCPGKAGYNNRVQRWATNVAVVVIALVSIPVGLLWQAQRGMNDALATLVGNLLEGGTVVVYNLRIVLNAALWLVAWAGGNVYLAPLHSKLPVPPDISLQDTIVAAEDARDMGQSVALGFLTLRMVVVSFFLQVILSAVACAVVGAVKRNNFFVKLSMIMLLLSLAMQCLLSGLLHQPMLSVLQATCTEVDAVFSNSSSGNRQAQSVVFDLFAKCDGVDSMAESIEFAVGYLNAATSQVDSMLPKINMLNSSINLDAALGTAPTTVPTGMPSAPALLSNGGVTMSPETADDVDASAQSNEEQQYSLDNAPASGNGALDGLNQAGQQLGSKADGLLLTMTNSSGSALGAFKDYAEAQLDAIQGFLRTIKIISGLITTMLGIAKCNTIMQLLIQARSDMCISLVNSLVLVTAEERSVVFLLMLAFLFTLGYSFVLASPRRRWVCSTCDAHFRFRGSLQAHRKVTCKEGLASFILPNISYSQLNRPGRFLIPQLKRALRQDLCTQIVAVASECGFPELQDKRASTLRGAEGIDPSNIVLTVDVKDTTRLDGPVKVEFFLRLPLSQEIPSNRNTVFRRLRGEADDPDGSSCTRGRCLFSKSRRVVAPEGSGHSGPQQQHAAFSPMLDFTHIPVKVIHTSPGDLPCIEFRGQKHCVEWLGDPPKVSPLVFSAGSQLLFRERDDGVQGTQSRTRMRRCIQAYAQGPTYKLHNERGADRHFVCPDEEFVALANADSARVFVARKSAPTVPLDWSFDNPKMLYTFGTVESGIGSRVELKAGVEDNVSAVFCNPDPWPSTRSFVEMFALTEYPLHGEEEGVDAPQTSTVTVDWHDRPGCCKSQSLCSCCPCWWDQNEGDIDFLGLFEEKRLFSKSTSMSPVASPAKIGLSVSKAGFLGPCGDNESSVIGSDEDSFRVTIPVMPELSMAGQLFTEKTGLKFGASPTKLDGVGEVIAGLVQGGAARLYNRSLRRPMHQEGRHGVTRAVTHFVRQMRSLDQFTGWVGLSHTHKASTLFDKTHEGCLVKVSTEVTDSEHAQVSIDTDGDGEFTPYIVKRVTSHKSDSLKMLTIVAVDDKIHGLVKLSNDLLFENPPADEQLFCIHLATEEPVSMNLGIPPIDLDALEAPEAISQTWAQSQANAAKEAAGRALQTVDDCLCDCIPNNFDEVSEMGTLELLIDVFRAHRQRSVCISAISDDSDTAVLSVHRTLVGFDSETHVNVRALPIVKADAGATVVLSGPPSDAFLEDGNAGAFLEECLDEDSSKDGVLDLTWIRVGESAISHAVSIRVAETGLLVPAGSVITIHPDDASLVPNLRGTAGRFTGSLAGSSEEMLHFEFAVREPFREEKMVVVKVEDDHHSLEVKQRIGSHRYSFDALHASFLEAEEQVSPGTPIKLHTNDSLRLAFKTFLGPFFSQLSHAIVVPGRDCVHVARPRHAAESASEVVQISYPGMTEPVECMVKWVSKKCPKMAPKGSLVAGDAAPLQVVDCVSVGLTSLSTFELSDGSQFHSPKPMLRMSTGLTPPLPLFGRTTSLRVSHQDEFGALVDFNDFQHQVFVKALCDSGETCQVDCSREVPRVVRAGVCYTVSWIGSPSTATQIKLKFREVTETLVTLSDGTVFENLPVRVTLPVKWIKQPSYFLFSVLLGDLETLVNTSTSPSISTRLGRLTSGRTTTFSARRSVESERRPSIVKLSSGATSYGILLGKDVYVVDWVDEGAQMRLSETASRFLDVESIQDGIVTLEGNIKFQAVPCNNNPVAIVRVHPKSGPHPSRVELSDGSSFKNPEKRCLHADDFRRRASAKAPRFMHSLVKSRAVCTLSTLQSPPLIMFGGEEIDVVWEKQPSATTMAAGFLSFVSIDEPDTDTDTGESVWHDGLRVELSDGSVFFNPYVAALRPEAAAAIFSDIDVNHSGSIDIDEWLSIAPRIEDILSTKQAGIRQTGFTPVCQSFTQKATASFSVIGGKQSVAIYKINLSKKPWQNKVGRRCLKICATIGAEAQALPAICAVLFCVFMFLLIPQGLLLMDKMQDNPYLSYFLVVAGATGFYGSANAYTRLDRRFLVALALCILAYTFDEVIRLERLLNGEIVGAPCHQGALGQTDVGEVAAAAGSSAASNEACPSNVLALKLSTRWFVVLLILHHVIVFVFGVFYVAVHSTLLTERSRDTFELMASSKRKKRQRTKHFSSRVKASSRRTKRSKSVSRGRTDCHHIWHEYCCNKTFCRGIALTLRLYFILLLTTAVAFLMATHTDSQLFKQQIFECNGEQRLCSLTFDQVVYPMTHGSAASVDNSTIRGESTSFVEPSQFESILEQLQKGVRALHFDSVQAWGEQGELHVCEKERRMGCSYGHMKLEKVLADVAAFLSWDESRRAHNLLEVRPGGDIITLVFQGAIPAAGFEAAFKSASLLSKVYNSSDARYSNGDVSATMVVEPVGASGWPTLGSMLCLKGFVAPSHNCSSTPIVVFAESIKAPDRLTWVLPLWTHVWQTRPQVFNKTSLSCHYSSGNKTAPLMMKNHYLNKPGPSPALSSEIQYKSHLLSSLHECSLQGSGQLPNFFAVDFVGVGDVISVASLINRGGSGRTAELRDRLWREWVFMMNPRDQDGKYSTAQFLFFLLLAFFLFVGVVYPCVLSCVLRFTVSKRKQD